MEQHDNPLEMWMGVQRQMWSQWIDFTRQCDEASRPLWGAVLKPLSLLGDPLRTALSLQRQCLQAWTGETAHLSAGVSFDGPRHPAAGGVDLQRQLVETWLGAFGGTQPALWEDWLKAWDGWLREAGTPLVDASAVVAATRTDPAPTASPVASPRRTGTG